jgi:hypothetical protein
LKFGLFSFLDALIFAFLAWSLDAEYDDEACPDFAALERRCFSCTRSSGVMFCRLPTRVDSDAALAVGVFMAMVNEARSSGVIEAIRVLFAAMRFNTESSVFSREARPSAIAAMRRRSFSAASRRFRLGFFCFAPRSASSGRTALPSKRFSHFSDFRTVDCCDEHLWKVYVEHRRDLKWRVITTKELIRLKGLNTTRCFVPLYEPKEGIKRDLPIDPYVLGLQAKLSYQKEIPAEYMEGSLSQRLALVQGLMDSDGSVEKRSGTGAKSET